SAPVLVLDVGVDRPGGVGSSEGLAVAPRGVRLRLERPGLAAVRGVPRLGEERGVVELAVVLDEDRIDVLEGAVGVLVERNVRVEGVDAVGRAEAERAAGFAAGVGVAAAVRPTAAACCGCNQYQRPEAQR